jgi:hypothetical protein
MHDWVTTTVPAAAGALDGVAAPPPEPGSTRHYLGAVDVARAEVGAVAVVDVDAGGSAWVRAVTGDRSALTGLADALRAAGARRLLAPEPLPGDDGWRRLHPDPPLWALEL